MDRKHLTIGLLAALGFIFSYQSIAGSTCTLGTVNTSTPSMTANSDGSFDIRYASASCVPGSWTMATTTYGACWLNGGYYWSDVDDTGKNEGYYSNVYKMSTPNDSDTTQRHTLSYPGGSVHINAGDSRGGSKAYICSDTEGLASSGGGCTEVERYGTTCQKWVEAPSCKATDVMLDHKTLSPGQYEGHEVTAATNLSCTGGDVTVQLSFSSPTVNLTNGTTSDLYFSDTKSTTETLQVAENASKSISVTSKLHGSPPPGNFSGSEVLIVTPQ